MFFILGEKYIYVEYQLKVMYISIKVKSFQGTDKNLYNLSRPGPEYIIYVHCILQKTQFCKLLNSNFQDYFKESNQRLKEIIMFPYIWLSIIMVSTFR